jgi:hypothetical protein
MRQIIAFGKKIGLSYFYFLLKKPPNEEFELLKYATAGHVGKQKVNRDLLRVFGRTQDIQKWMAGYVAGNYCKSTDVSSFDHNYSIPAAADIVRSRLKLEEARFDNKECPDAGRAFKLPRDRVGDCGAMVMKGGIVGKSTRRVLDAAEFRSFVLPDEYAPLIFINGSDSSDDMMFSLSRGFVHVATGTVTPRGNRLDLVGPPPPLETFCGAVAAEVMVPTGLFKDKRRENKAGASRRVGRPRAYFKCGLSVVARRSLDACRQGWNYNMKLCIIIKLFQ